jgi:hypothetical protein
MTRVSPVARETSTSVHGVVESTEVTAATNMRSPMKARSPADRSPSGSLATLLAAPVIGSMR